MDDPINYFIGPFEAIINPGYPTGLKLYRQAKKEMDKETDKLYISVSNAKDIIHHFLSWTNKYGWGPLAFMLGTATGANNIFRLE